MASAKSVANYLVHLAAMEDEPELLTHMRLQKLLYYCQGWSLALRGKPMFKEKIEAWAHGPVVKAVYGEFSKFGDKPISADELTDVAELSTDEKEFVESVWNAYKSHSAFSLRAMTHAENPWKNARKGCSPAEASSAEITRDAMKDFFEKQAV